MNEAIEKALKTWYSKDHKLHFDPLHPAIKLAGEAGELLDLYGKDRFKPNFSWWQCKHCGYGDASHSMDDIMACPDKPYSDTKYTPLILDELGDFWYYLRILSYLSEKPPQDKYNYFEGELEKLLVSLNLSASTVAYDVVLYSQLDTGRLNLIYDHFLHILKCLDTDLEVITELNYRKLNSGPTNHGWKDA